MKKKAVDNGRSGGVEADEQLRFCKSWLLNGCLYESTLGPKVVSERLQEQALVTSLVTGNVPVENTCADNVKTLGNTEAIKLIMADVSDIEKRGEGSSGTQEKDPEDKELGKETTKEEAPTIPTKRQSFPEMPE
ncbi:hypothetical protein Tco_0502289, partial [Tanacetum coccineum]